MLTTLFLDLDGTLIQNAFRDTLFPRLCTHLADRTGLPPEAVLQRIMAEWERRGRENMDPVVAMDWDDISQTVATELGISCALSLSDECVAHASPPYIQALDDSPAVLQALRRPWRRLVLASR